jgi:hypothetical protein
VLIVGQLLDREGFCVRSKVVAANHPGRTFDVRNVHSLEAIRLRPVQRAVAVDLDHDPSRQVGELVHLEEDGRASTWAVADVDQDKLPAGPLYYSSQDVGPDDAAELRGIAITRSPAMTALSPIRVVGLEADQLSEADTLRLRRADPFLAGMLERARLAIGSRRYGDPIRVHRPAPPVERLMGGGYLADGELVPAQPRSAGGRMVRDDEGRVVGPLEYGPPGRILSVR